MYDRKENLTGKYKSVKSHHMKNQFVESDAVDIEKFEYCSTSHAAELIGVSHRTIQLWVESGLLEAWKTAGGHRRISLLSVHKLLDQRSGDADVDIGDCNGDSAKVPTSQVRKKKKLMIVDDDVATLRIYELEIRGWGLPLQIMKAKNGFDVLLKIGEYKPDMLISDLNMSGMDGFRMIRALRSTPAYAKMLIIVISGLDRSTVRSMGLPSEIPFFSKPVSFPRLRNLVEAAFNQLEAVELAPSSREDDAH